MKCKFANCECKHPLEPDTWDKEEWGEHNCDLPDSGICNQPIDTLTAENARLRETLEEVNKKLLPIWNIKDDKGHWPVSKISDYIRQALNSGDGG